MKNYKRYFVFSKVAAVRTGTLKPLKNADTRQEARDFKATKPDGTIYGIYDRQASAIIR